MATPQWRGKHNGLLGDASAMADAGDVNQLLITHPAGALYRGNPVLSPSGAGGAGFAYPLATADLDQPLTMSGTVIGRVDVPLLAVGQGADLLVSLCADSSGVPGTVITQTRVPASWIYQSSAVAGASQPSSVLPPLLEVTGNPLAIAADTPLAFGAWQSIPWTPSASGASGSLSTAQLAQGGDYMIFAGGINTTTQNSVATVAVVSWAGSGNAISPVVSAPSLPQALTQGAFVATPDCLVYAGGVNVNGATHTVVSTVYVASWNPTSGAVGAWTVQTALPQALVDPGMGCYAATDTVYLVGGSTNYAPENNFVSTVYYSTLSGQQLTSWTAGYPLPIAIADPSVAVVGNWLIVTGGYNAITGSATVYYAPIDPTTGIPGAWTVGPPVPSGLYVENIPAVSDSGMAWAATFSISTGVVAQDVLTLSWDANGPGTWTHQVNPFTAINSDQVAAMVATDSGTYQLFNFQPFNAYMTASVSAVPTISVPLPATGLTNGGTYHILLQQQGGDLNDYLILWSDLDAFPGNPTALTSPRAGYTWTALTPAGTSIPVGIYDGAPRAPGEKPLHFWEDSGARITTLVSATTPDRRPLGLLEATAMPTAQNQNQGFETGIAPWTVTGGTATQSSVQVYEGQFSCRIVPTGSASQVYVTSEFLPCLPGQSITAATQVWFTNAVTTNFSMSVNWYTAGKVLISTSTTNISVPAATWTAVSNVLTAVSAPSLAYYYTLQPMLSGTPAAGQVWYVDNTIGYQTFVGNQQSSVTELNYPAGLAFPSQSYPVIGTSGLA